MPLFDVSPTSAQRTCAEAYLDFIAHVPQTAYFQTALEHLLPTISQSNCPSDVSVVEKQSCRALHMWNIVIGGGLLGNTVLLRVYRV
jgi:hypothetical protein